MVIVLIIIKMIMARKIISVTDNIKHILISKNKTILQVMIYSEKW